MKFIYTYRTSDNVLHEGIVKAATKEAAYALLRGKGVKPGQMKEAPGLLNMFLGKYKRWSAIILLSLATVALLTIVNRQENVIQRAALEQSGEGPLDRRQLLGDDTVINRGIETDWAVVFPRSCDRFLARFAQPGHAVSRIEPESLCDMADAIQESLGVPIPVNDSDLDEYKQIRRIVAGMREELSAYLKDGGNVLGYLECLVQRQTYEVNLRTKAKAQLTNARRVKSYDEYMTEWKKVNLELRAIGLALIPIEVE